MFGLFASIKPLEPISGAERTKLIEKLCATRGSQYRPLKQYHAL
jgi:hypothetical protein